MGKLMTGKALRSVKNAAEFKKQLEMASDAAIGVIFIRTREAFRCQEVIQELSIELDMDFQTWTVLSGWQKYPSPQVAQNSELDLVSPMESDKGTIPIDKALAAIDDFSQDGFFVLMNPQPWFAAPPFQQHIKNHVRKAIGNSQRLIIITSDAVDIPIDIEDDVHLIDFKPPSHAELKAYWPELMRNIDGECRPSFDDEDIDLIIQNSIGMTAMEFDTAIAMACVRFRDGLMADSDSVSVTDFIKVIMETKVEVIKKTDILELMPDAGMEDIGGLDLLKIWVAARAKAYTDEAKAYGIDPPKGVLVVGPPGTGKSLFGKATASVLGIPCIKFDIGKVFGKYVGESEGKMRKALSLVESMAPCVLLVDEIDKAFGGMGSGGDSGTSSRVFGTFLTWMQERNQEEAPIFVAATANNVTNLPPELIRKGRMDEIFAATFPGLKDREAIVKIHTEKRGHSLPQSEYRQIASVTKDFVGAELEALIKDAIISDFNAGKKKLIVETCLEEAKQIIPVSKSFPEKVKFMNDWAKNNAKPASSDTERMTIEGKPKKRRSIRSRTRNAKPSTRLDD